MTPQELIDKWAPSGPAYALSERAGAQPHFMDLCSILGVATPGDAINYCFEPYVTKTGSGRGFADVWKRGHFAWEYKAPGRRLDAALKQLMMYSLPLENPPLLVVIPGDLARQWLALPNPNGRSNADVVKPWANGKAIIERPKDKWIIDFGTDMSEADASLYEAPFRYLTDKVRPKREKNARASYKTHWWLLAEPIPQMRVALLGLPRYLTVLGTAKHRIFTWVHASVLPDHALIAFARSDDMTFGILQSRFHVLWSLRLGTALDDRPRYTLTTAFDTFPFPSGLAPSDTSTKAVQNTAAGALIPDALETSVTSNATAIAEAARRLNDLREKWLNPPEWVVMEPDITPLGMTSSPYPPRAKARPGHEIELSKRTLTKLYNDMPTWLKAAHRQVDEAVAAAYGWTDYTPDMTDSEIRTRLLKMNLARPAHR